jgi:predicted PhzF superfamily epimerase YddE/YHI9
MQIPKEQIISLIESRMGGDQAQQASQQLPDQVDHEQHADLLKKFNIEPSELLQKFAGGLGGL